MQNGNCILCFSYTAVYEAYLPLLSQEIDKQIERFTSQEHPLKDYVRDVERMKKMASDVASLPVYIPMHFFLLDCTRINEVCSEAVPSLHSGAKAGGEPHGQNTSRRRRFLGSCQNPKFGLVCFEQSMRVTVSFFPSVIAIVVLEPADQKP